MKYLLTTLLLVLVATVSMSQIPQAEAELQQIMKQYETVGLAVAVVRQNEIVYVHAFGKKDVEHNITLTDKDIFRIASISKSFSATTVMQLREVGKLSLDDDFSDLIGFKIRNPKYPAKVITLKMVLSHTSSINDKQGYFNLDVINPDKNPDWAKCYNDYAPGKGYQYCNLNFNMVGAVIEKLTGERFDQRIKHGILDPLGLYGGYCVDSLKAALFTTLYAYDSATKQFIPSPNAYASRRDELSNYVMGYSTPVFSPTGGMKIAAGDLAKYMMMHMNMGSYNGVTIMSKSSARLMQRKVSDKDGYGLAIRTVRHLIPGKRLKGHTGSAYGLYSAMFFHPRRKFGIVVITNGCLPTETDGIQDLLRASINSLYRNFIK